MVGIFFNFWSKVFFVLSIMTMLFCYTTMPDSVAVSHTEWGKANGFISLQSFFYIASGVILGINVLFWALRDQIIKIDFAKLYPNSQWAANKIALSALIKNWINAFLAFVNTYLVFALLGLYNINSTPDQHSDFNYNWLLLIGVVFMLIILFSLPLLLLYTNPKTEE